MSVVQTSQNTSPVDSSSHEHFDGDAIASHLRKAVASSILETDPGPHMVVSELLPPEVYSWLLRRIPPADEFLVVDRVKANFDPVRVEGDSNEWHRSWAWLHNDVLDQVLKPALLDVFSTGLRGAYSVGFGPELAEEALGFRHHAIRGRMMLRRPGYRLAPHRDMKTATLTGLVYLARPGDSREYGTDLYRVEGDREAPSVKTYYPEAHGERVELVRRVPCQANSALFFLNVPGMAHGAFIPPDSSQAERYAYQFYVGPKRSKIRRLVSRLPPEMAATWADLLASGD